MLNRKDLLGLIDVSAPEITEILDLAHEFKNRIKNGEKKMSHLEGKTVTVLFYENSTRLILRQAVRQLPKGKRSWIQAKPWMRREMILL